MKYNIYQENLFVFHYIFVQNVIYEFEVKMKKDVP